MPNPAKWTPDLATIIEEAFERIGSEARTGYDIRSARRSLQYIFTSWENLQLNLWRLLDEGLTLQQGVTHYPLPADTIDLIDVTINSYDIGSGHDFSMTRISPTTWMQIPDKTLLGRPVQYMVQRQVPAILVVWPAPQFANMTLRWWRATRMMDVGNADTTADVPSRFLEALTAGLAFHLAMKAKDPAARTQAPTLKAYYQEQLDLATSEDRDRATLRLVPRMLHR